MNTRHHLAQVYRFQGKHVESIDRHVNVLEAYHAAALDDHVGAYSAWSTSLARTEL
ncbi:hypothetical protein F4782DRAFT_523677 [Xylaria castorea]|nr:hypothetical protein F4782DRAFT_523677 [Xylaria castorea]